MSAAFSGISYRGERWPCCFGCLKHVVAEAHLCLGSVIVNLCTATENDLVFFKLTKMSSCCAVYTSACIYLPVCER